MNDIDYPIPTDLSSCFSVIDMIMKNSAKSESDWFKNTPEDEVMGNVHHGFGRWIRNTWGLWDKSSVLHKYFANLGLWHADDMSGVIITSYHRHINGRDILLKEQIQHYLDYWTNYEKENGPVEKN